MVRRGARHSGKTLLDPRIRYSALALFLVHAAQAHAQLSADSATVPQVTVAGSQTDAQARRDFIAGKIVIGRKRIEESGVRTVEELLKREPAVTVGADGNIGLLNMPGYTQILVDGQPPSPSQGPNVLELLHVERVEIVKSSVAEFGPFGIAGTINIVTRSHARKTSTEASGAISSLAGRLSESAALSHTSSEAGSALRTSAHLSANHARTPSASQVRQRLRVAGQSDLEQSRATIDGLSDADNVALGGSLTWQRAADDTVSFSPDFFASKDQGKTGELRRYADSATLDAQQHDDSALTMLFLPVKWKFKPGPKSRIDMTLNTNVLRMESTRLRGEALSARAPVSREERESRRARTHLFELSYKRSLQGGHDLSLGLSETHAFQDTDYERRIDGLPDPALAALGSNRDTVTRKERVHVQDEWRVSDSLALSGGLSGAAHALDVREGSYSGHRRFVLWSPSLHASKKLGNDDKRQLRLSVARSYKAPDDDSFTLRPVIHPLAPCPATGLCGPNTIDTADTAGNLALRPEQALGVNLSYEHGIGDDSQITFEMYARRIKDKFGTDISLDTVPWSATPRYVSRPVNLGEARSTGIDIEFALALRDLSPAAPKASLRGSVGLARSSLSRIPGPDNRLERQLPWTAKLGATLAAAGLPLKFDLDAAWSPGAWWRTSATERIAVARRLDLDFSLNWSIRKGQRLVAGIKRSLPGTGIGAHDYGDSARYVRVDTAAQRYTACSIRFETAL